MRPGQAFEDRLAEGRARMGERSDYEIVEAALDIFTVLDFNGVPGAVVIAEALAAAKRMQAEIDRLQGELLTATKQTGRSIEYANEQRRIVDRLQGEKDAWEEAAHEDRLRAIDTDAENTRLQARIKELEGALERVRDVDDDAPLGPIQTAEDAADAAYVNLSDREKVALAVHIADEALAPSRETDHA